MTTPRAESVPGGTTLRHRRDQPPKPMANPHREDTKVRRSIDVLREYYSQFTEGKVYESPNGHEIDPVERIVHGELAYFNWKRCSYTSIILNAEPGDVLDDGYIEEFFGHAVHVKEA